MQILSAAWRCWHVFHDTVCGVQTCHNVLEPPPYQVTLVCCWPATLQRINHFHGMLELCRKRSMAKHLSALAALLPPELKYDFFPQTWQLPGQLNAFLAAAKAAGKKQAFIVKPDAGCQVRFGPGAGCHVQRAIYGLPSRRTAVAADCARVSLSG